MLFLPLVGNWNVRYTGVILLPARVQEPLLGQGLLIIEASRSHSDTPHMVGFLWTSDQPSAENGCAPAVYYLYQFSWKSVKCLKRLSWTHRHTQRTQTALLWHQPTYVFLGGGGKADSLWKANIIFILVVFADCLWGLVVFEGQLTV
jgi:hypothetical protein